VSDLCPSKLNQKDQLQAEYDYFDRLVEAIEEIDPVYFAKRYPELMKRLVESELIDQWVQSWDIG